MRLRPRKSDPADTSLLIPVGHCIGAYDDVPVSTDHFVQVRLGPDVIRLDDAQFAVWGMAHGLPTRPLDQLWNRASVLAAARDAGVRGADAHRQTRTEDDVRWTRQAIVDAASEAGIPGAQSILDALADLGPIAEVLPGTEQAREFAASYRIQSLLIGFGNTPEDPVSDAIGLVGLPPVANVRPRVFEVWQWAHLWPSLWHACEGLAYVAGQTQGASDAADPHKVLDRMLEAMRTLISSDAAYPDVLIAPKVDSASPASPQ